MNIVGNDLSQTRSPMHGDAWPKFLQQWIDNDFEIEFNNYDDTNFDALICFNFVEQLKKCKSIFSNDVPFKSIVVLEPKAVHPLAHENKFLRNFNVVISTSQNWYLSDNQINMKYPLVTNYNSFLAIHERQIESALIQANKYSCIRGEQYTLRRQLLKHASKGEIDIILAGHGWQKSKKILFLDILKYFIRTLLNVQLRFISNPFRFLISRPIFWIGPVQDKITFLGGVKRNVVIENSRDYVSEKLIDSLRTGSIPFYVGPKISDYGIPSNLVVQCEPIVHDIISKLKSYDDNKLQEIQNRINHFVLEGGLHDWDNSMASMRICDFLISEFHRFNNQ